LVNLFSPRFQASCLICLGETNGRNNAVERKREGSDAPF
jgi:hypothetical protein